MGSYLDAGLIRQPDFVILRVAMLDAERPPVDHARL